MSAPKAPPPNAPPGKAGGQGPLTKKLGPLPVWVWLAIVGVIVIVYSMSKNGSAKKKTGQTPDQQGAQYGDTSAGGDYTLIGGNQRPPIVFESFQTLVGAPPMGGRPFPPCAPPPPGPCAPGAGRWIMVAPWKKHGAPWNASCRGMAQECYGDGSRWPEIWNAPENSGLRRRRRDCDHIQAGDRIWVPYVNGAGTQCAPPGPGPFSPGPYGGGAPCPPAPGGVGMPPAPPPPPVTLPPRPGLPAPAGRPMSGPPAMMPGRTSSNRRRR